jgi:hypothetical protein
LRGGKRKERKVEYNYDLDVGCDEMRCDELIERRGRRGRREEERRGEKR